MSSSKPPTKWVMKKQSERDFHKMFKLLRSKKKMETLKRAIQPRVKNQKVSIGMTKEDIEADRRNRMEPYEMHKEYLSSIDKTETSDIQELNKQNDLRNFYITTFNEWERVYLTSRSFIERDLKENGTKDACDETGITRFMLPSPESVLDTHARYYRRQYHIVCNEEDNNNHLCIELVISIKQLYEILKNKTPVKKDTHTVRENKVLCDCGGGLQEDQQHGVFVCIQCGVVSNRVYTDTVTFQEMQQSSIRSPIPYERIAHVSW
jgi:hypothetical protein